MTTDVTKRRKESAVGNLGVIETGLPTNRHSIQTVTSEFREGRCILEKCEVISRTVSFCGATNKVDVKVKNKVLLHPLRVDLPAGSITAVLGGAGSGTSTLLKFLAGQMDKNVTYDGKVNLPGSKSYFAQETHLHRFYTPRTYIKHYQRLMGGSGSPGGCCKLLRGKPSNNAPSSVGGNRKLRRSGSAINDDEGIERLLDALRIDVDRRDTIVGDMFKKGLNPGEQRRLDLGLTVSLRAPDTLFCESPDLGLDSETSLNVMEFLKGYVAKDSNRRVIVTLDRPSLFVWNLVDNVILLSKGRVVYEGPRFDMESFFAYHGKPTPKRFSPLEHYIACVSNFRSDNNAVNWESALKQWQEKVDEDEGDYLADDIEICFPSAIPEVLLISANNETTVPSWGKSWLKFLALLQRSILDALKNPGILGLRILMYTPFTLFLGLLFYNLQDDESYESVNSRAALLFYSSSFYIFMVVAVLPFLAKERLICRKEVLNGCYHPITHHFAVSVGSIPNVVILSFIITLILVGMVKLHNPVQFFLILLLALWNAESYAILLSTCVTNYILGIIILAGIFGLAMPLEGFMLVPSIFPSYLRWLYLVPFHTYVFRSFMYNEFAGTSFGELVLKSYEIEGTNIKQDMVVLLCYSLVIHCVSVAVLLFSSRGRTKKQKDP
eukprot:scaffold23018_cov205-Skeletonema_marinoi.AAC.6